MKKFLRTAAALALAGCMMTANVFAATAFTDVPSDYWGKTFIDQAADAGLVSGMGDGTYGINGKLSSAQFTTMVCNLICKDDVSAYQKSNPSSDWWNAYMSVAYSKGFLKNTTVGDARLASSAWSASSVNAEISRYDMAQIMVNVANSKGWTMPTTTQVLAAQAKIADWNKIPAKYQTAVATAYAKEYLSGMDSIGTFAGDQTMTRTHGAVVICKLLNENKAANAVTTPTFTNTTKLVNGKDATEKNVVDAVKALKAEYPNNYLWNMNNTYRSVVLGNSVGADAFTLMLADRVFGNFTLGVSDADELKAGDVVFLNSLRTHVLVTEVDEGEFSYVCCNSTGKVSWGNTFEIKELTNWDTIYTRYEDKGSSDSEEDTLSNGEEATVANVKDLIEQFLDEEYDEGSDWTKSGKYTAFKSAKVYDDEAFAYHFSNYIFGDLEVEDVDDYDDLRVGDVLYLDSKDRYAIIIKISGDTITFLSVDDDEVYKATVDVDNLDDDDFAYTRYPADNEDDDDDGVLSNGKAATSANVKALIEKFLDEEYQVGDDWDDDESYKSTDFKNKTVYGNEAFAYTFSDYIFDGLDVVEVEDFDDLRVGDVIYHKEWKEYLVVTKISGDTIDFVGVYGKTIYEDDLDVDDLTSADKAYTRYPSSSSSSSSNTSTLSNGKAVTSANVTALIEKFLDEEYQVGDDWDDDETYKSTYFYKSSVSGNRAFAYKLSDYVFGKLSVSELKSFDNLRAGDVIYYKDWEEYLVVTKVSGSTVEFVGVYDQTIYEDDLKIKDLSSADKAYTRYTTKGTSSSSNSDDTLSNGKAVTAANVRSLLAKFQSEKFKAGDAWSDETSYKSTSFEKGTVYGNKAFAYYLSDYVFGNLAVADVDDFDKLSVGDVIYKDNWDEYLTVTKVSGSTITIIGVENQKVYQYDLSVSSLSSSDKAYTRYPS